MRLRLPIALLAVLAMTNGFDTSGVDAFWPAYDQLRRGQEPSPAIWDALFATPGYAQLEAREHRRAAIVEAMRVALNPARAGARESVLVAGGFRARSLRHLMGLPAAHDSVIDFERRLLSSGLIDAARRAVAAYLPPRLADSVAPPPVALVFFADDGRGYPDLVIVDLLRLMRTGVDTGFFAHELFHYYRRHIQVATRSLDPRDAGVDELLA